MTSPQPKESSPDNKALSIEQEIRNLAIISLANRLPPSVADNYNIFDEPLVKFADGSDPIFTDYKTIIAPSHLTPREALAQAYGKSPEDIPAHLSVISWILPITEKTRQSNRNERLTPSRIWSHTRWYGEKFNDVLRHHVVEIITGMGYLATAPALQSYFKVERNEKGPYSNWSERHIAYVAGHGTFSLSDGFITASGIAHRCGSVVTDLKLPVSLRTARAPYSNCLFYADGSCKACIKRCPAEAISEEGHDKIKCQTYQRGIGYVATNQEYDDNVSVMGCGLCQAKVPCEFGIPTNKGKQKRAP
ncbi:epoxyqueuosine reductase [Chloroflexota bacterium]